MNMNLNKKVAIVTGASRGIGKATALNLANEGANIIIQYYTNFKGAQEVKEKIEQLGCQAIVVQADIRKSKDINRMIKFTIEKFKRIDILVNNAGITEPEPVFKTTKVKWDNMIKTNLTSVFLCCKAVIKYMKKQKEGSIINLSSVCGENGGLGAGVHYCAAKAGVIGLTKSGNLRNWQA